MKEHQSVLEAPTQQESLGPAAAQEGTITVAELVGRTRAQLGVAQIFGVIGSGNFRVTNSLRRHGVPYVATRHEAGAITMADAYARTSGQFAAMTTHRDAVLPTP